MTARDVDQAIALLAAGQHTVFARHQAVRLGATPAMVQRRRTTGAWTVEAPCVYGFPGACTRGSGG